MSDLLTDETVQEILYRFDVDHAFPTKFVHGGNDEQEGFWRRLWRRLAASLGFRGRTKASVPSEPRAGDDGIQTITASFSVDQVAGQAAGVNDVHADI